MDIAYNIYILFEREIFQVIPSLSFPCIAYLFMVIDIDWKERDCVFFFGAGGLNDEMRTGESCF